MQKTAKGRAREERVKQSVKREPSVLDYITYIPIGNAVKKLIRWKKQGAVIIYLSSHEVLEDVRKDKLVLNKFKFPQGKIIYRKDGETYKNIAEKIIPDILIEDDCESIGGKKEMTITFIKSNIKKKIKSIVVKEFSGIDNLPDQINDLITYKKVIYT